ncbi:MAG: PD40 domain-containing protein [Deltaproteobacteria bacterium]|nr:PD40 domain-containing protein [Deltaproteobacteria bacterium]
MHNPRIPYGLLSRSACLAVVLAAGFAAADQPASPNAPIRLETRLAAGPTPTLASPLRIGQPLRFPLWTDQGLWRSIPSTLAGLERIQKPGTPAWDPTTRAWYASAQGTLVRVEGDGRLTVVADNVQGGDVDVRAALKRAVSREPNDTIVLHDWSSSPSTRKVLLAGGGFFGPRFSPDGSAILVKESRAGGGHMWMVSPDGTAVDLGQGYDPTWHPDGRQVVFDRVTHDGLTVSTADLWVVDTQTRVERLIAGTSGVAEVQPTVSPDGRWVAFADGRTGQGYVAELNLAQGRR